VSIPLPDTSVPARVAQLAGGAQLRPVWINGVGCVTFRANDDRYIKWGPRNAETSFVAEAERLRWAGPFTRVPSVLSVGGNSTHEWMVTAALTGESAVAPRWLVDVETAVRAVGEGLRALHNALPVSSCPFIWDVPSRIATAQERGIVIPDNLLAPPPVDQLVVCHGDACCPNTLVGESGRWAGHVDLGALGVGDRWADIAVAAMSTEWNYGFGWETTLLNAYGIEADAERSAYYRALWNAT
jgi:kanamycin kinase